MDPEADSNDIWIERALESLEREASAQASCQTLTEEGAVEYSFRDDGTPDVINTAPGVEFTAMDQSGASYGAAVVTRSEEVMTRSEGVSAVSAGMLVTEVHPSSQVVHHAEVNQAYSVAEASQASHTYMVEDMDTNGLDHYVRFEHGGEIARHPLRPVAFSPSIIS